MPPSTLLASVAIGVGATLLMDAWNLFLKRALDIPSLDFCLLGRWVLHMPSGRFRHASIAAAHAKPRECVVGWLAHYTIGVAFAIGFVLLASGDWLAAPTALPAIGYGLVTVVSPFLVLQPALGLGIAASRTAHPAKARMKSVMTHLVFGVGLYVSALSLRYVVGGSL